jgi:hypothetical protein
MKDAPIIAWFEPKIPLSLMDNTFGALANLFINNLIMICFHFINLTLRSNPIHCISFNK